MKFQDLNIIDPIFRALQDLNYEKPTPIQEKAIPIVLDRNDILGIAQTGTGKTAAFAIPIIQHLVNDRERNTNRRKVKALIVTPTRELAIQIGDSFKTYGKNTNVHNTVIFGGVSKGSPVSARNSSAWV